jgi:phosphoglycolate phosphatase-like HAD superfamily hydrolase
VAVTAIVFDLDGTLFDTIPWYSHTLNVLTGCSAPEVETRLRSGANLMRVIAECGVGRGQFLEASARERGLLRSYPGTEDTLAELRRRQVPLGLASSLPGPLVEGVILAGTSLAKILMDPAVTATKWPVIHAGNCRPAKPRPDPILRCLERLFVPAGRNAWYMGDRRVDQEAAERAGVSFAWAAYGYSDGVDPHAVALRVDKVQDLLGL